MTQIQQLMAALLFACSVGITGLLTGYHYGAMSVEVKQQTAVIKQTAAVRKEETQSAEVINNTAKDFENAKSINKVAADKLIASLGGLRFSTTDKRLPTIGTSTSERTNGTGSEWNAAGEVDFTDIGKQVIELGQDYDNAVAQIKALNATLAEDRRLCNVK